MGFGVFQHGPISDWLDLAEAEAKDRGIEFERNPLTSKATFLINNGEIGGKVRTSEAPERNHPRIWHEYDDEPFLTRTHPNVITVALDLTDPTDTFSPSDDCFIVVRDNDRPHLPGNEEKPYFYIEQKGEYYYNKQGQRKYLPTDSWDAIFRAE
ncbi:hypothetical protein [Halobellus rufus]|uniref:hypothetical protein n=1 Tax=Halobellus rufus TaxID=1448860 RepID=UPI0012E02FF1|nr:hypothetical protein [Halobellus rufus]